MDADRVDDPGMDLYTTEDGADAASPEPVTVDYGIETVEDARGEGVDVYTSTDDIYRVRFGDETVTSIYREDGEWTATIRYLVEGDEDGFQRFHGVAGRLHDAYDTAISRSIMEFRAELEEDGVVTDGNEQVELRYRPRHDLDMESFKEDLPRKEKLKVYAKEVGMGGSVIGIPGSVLGGAIGGGLGLLLGDPVHTAMLGAGIIGGGGSVLGGVAGTDWAGDMIDGKQTQDLTPREAYTHAGATEDSRADNPAYGLFWKMGERNRLETLLNAAPDPGTGDIPAYDEEMIDRYHELEGSELASWEDAVMDVLFYRPDELRGVSVTHETGSYAEMKAFLDAVLDVEPPGEEPDLYRSLDAFQQIMYGLTKEPGLRHDAEALIHTVYRRDGVDPEIVEWLEEEHPDLMQQVGREHTLEGGAQR